MDVTDRLSKTLDLKRKHLRQRLQTVRGFHGRGDKRTIFVSGLQRSGTNMLMSVLDRARETEVFHENDSRAFETYIMRDRATIRHLIAHSPASHVVVKALQEGQVLRDILDDFPASRAIWMWRDYADVVNSQIRRWPGFRNKLELILEDRSAGDWRGVNMTDETWALLHEIYRPELTTADTAALFWVYRNRLFFDQALDQDDRVLLLKYEDVVQYPDRTLPALGRFLDLTVTPAMSEIVKTTSIRKNTEPALSPDVAALCDEMHARLRAIYVRQAITSGREDIAA